MASLTIHERRMRAALHLASDHTSRGTYDMVCMLTDGKHYIYGYNRLNAPGHRPPQGRHAETDAIKQASKLGLDISRFSLYVAGVKRSNPMLNTSPCEMCREYLDLPRNLYYYVNGRLVHERNN